MAGKRQHYLPRFLQRGFLDPSSTGAERTWLHRRAGPARLVGIGDVGVGEYFYSRPVPGETSLDDVITSLEGDLGKIIASYRTAKSGAEVDAAVAASTVHHLITRTAHIRSLLAAASTRFFESLDDIIGDPARLAAMMGLDSVELGPLVIESIQRSVAQLVPLGVPEALSERFMALYLRERGPASFAEISEPMRAAFAAQLPNIGSQIRDTHTAILSRDPSEQVWIERLSAFDWRVDHAEGLILPDCVGLASDGVGSLLPLLFIGGESTSVVVVPIASDRMLVGLRPGTEMVDLADFNARAAASSDNFFIAALPFDGEGLAGSIGIAGSEAIEETIADALAQAGAEVLGPRYLAALSATQNDFSYSLQFDGSADDPLGERIKQVLQGLISTLARRMPLEALDGFTIAADYGAALAKFREGDGETPIETRARAFAQGIAMPITVMRDGVAKVHIVLAADVALGLLSEEPLVRARSLNILIKMLALLAHNVTYQDAVVPLAADLITQVFYPAIGGALRSWYSAREAGFVDPDIGEAYATLVLDSLTHAREAIVGPRAHFIETQDLGPLVATALSVVTAILNHSADWLGHRAGLAEDMPFPGGDLPQRLAAWDLEHWIELFGRDLAAVYETRDGTLDLARAARLGGHVERLFWAMGLFAWPVPDDVNLLAVDPGPAPVVENYRDPADTIGAERDCEGDNK